MKIILGGYFETAFVRSVDEIIRPNMNHSTNPYYMCLNRNVPKGCFHRAGTFIAIADELILPSIDWAMPPRGDGPPELHVDRFGATFSKFGGNEWDNDSKALARIIVANRFLSQESWAHISRIDLSNFDPKDLPYIRPRLNEFRDGVAQHYLCRVFLQIRAAAAVNVFLILSEDDIKLLTEIGEFFQQCRLPLPYSFPDFTKHSIAADEFTGGLLNFSPEDALSVAAVRADSTIKKYAAKVRDVMGSASSEEGQRSLLSAMSDAYRFSARARKVEKIFEIVSWVVKPLHYVPGVDKAVAIAEDVKDLLMKWLDTTVEEKEWFAVGARMSDVAIRDYLARKGNQLAEETKDRRA